MSVFHKTVGHFVKSEIRAWHAGPFTVCQKGKEGSGGCYSYSVKSYTDAPGRKYKHAFHRISFVFNCIQSCYGRNVLIYIWDGFSAHCSLRAYLPINAISALCFYQFHFFQIQTTFKENIWQELSLITNMVNTEEMFPTASNLYGW